MGNFKCVNKDCSEFKKEVTVPKVKYIFSDGELIPKNPIKCKVCGKNLEHIPKKGLPEIGKFSSLSDQEKKRVLRERANKHYDKTGKEQKRELFKTTMRKMKGE